LRGARRHLQFVAWLTVQLVTVGVITASLRAGIHAGEFLAIHWPVGAPSDPTRWGQPAARTLLRGRRFRSARWSSWVLVDTQADGADAVGHAAASAVAGADTPKRAEDAADAPKRAEDAADAPKRAEDEADAADAGVGGDLEIGVMDQLHLPPELDRRASAAAPRIAVLNDDTAASASAVQQVLRLDQVTVKVVPAGGWASQPMPPSEWAIVGAAVVVTAVLVVLAAVVDASRPYTVPMLLGPPGTGGISVTHCKRSLGVR